MARNRKNRHAVNLAKKTATTAPNSRGSQVIRKQPKREVSYEIVDIKGALNMAKNPDTPDRNKLHKIYDYIQKDGHLKSQIKVALLKVLAEPWMLYQNGTPDVAATALIKKRWFNTLIQYILEAELHGYSVVEATGISPIEGSKAEVALIDREYVSIEKQWILIEGTINGAYLPYADIMQEIDLLEFGSRNDLGCLLECAYNVIWKFYSRSDWGRCNEKWGMPILSITANTNNDTELDALEKRAANFGTDGYFVGQEGDTINIIERTGQNMHATYFDNIKYCDDQNSKIINGQGGSSDPKAFVGAAQVQERTMEDFTLARLQTVVDEVQEKVLPYLIYKGFALDGYQFDYPALVRERERKINGLQTPTDPIATPAKKGGNK